MLPALRRPDFPVATDADVLRPSDVPYYTACPNPFLAEFVERHGRLFGVNYFGRLATIILAGSDQHGSDGVPVGGACAVQSGGWEHTPFLRGSVFDVAGGSVFDVARHRSLENRKERGSHSAHSHHLHQDLTRRPAPEPSAPTTVEN